MDVLHEYGVEFPCGGAGTCGNCKVQLLKGNIAVSEKHAAALSKKQLSSDWRLACMSVVEDDITLEIAQWEQLILADNSTFDFSPQDGYGIAVDLGSTTIVSQLVNLRDGSIAAVQQGINPQAKYGGDIMSRIAFSLKENSNAETLAKLTREAVWGQIKQLLKDGFAQGLSPAGGGGRRPGVDVPMRETSTPAFQVPPPAGDSHPHAATITKITIVGNTVMHHIFCGLDLTPLATFPFLTPHNESVIFFPKQLSWKLPDDVQICFAPNLGSFVGSDILAGILAARMHEKQSYSVLIDLGTNGEIAVGNSDKILCSSTSAGPAFEGAVILHGMRASTGAIASLERNAQGVLQAHVIGNTIARGICGSGLIDAIATLVASGDIEPMGNISDDHASLPLADSVMLSQRDVRELQLAKSAIATGVLLLMRQLNITANDVENVYIAGGFGSYINTCNAIKIGLLEFTESKITKLGNSALIGAKMLLFDNKNSAEKITQITSHVSLETDPEFQNVFCEKLEFPIS